jgi:hypothetical protein
MPHPFDPGYIAEPYLTLCAEYPQAELESVMAGPAYVLTMHLDMPILRRNTLQDCCPLCQSGVSTCCDADDFQLKSVMLVCSCWQVRRLCAVIQGSFWAAATVACSLADGGQCTSIPTTDSPINSPRGWDLLASPETAHNQEHLYRSTIYVQSHLKPFHAMPAQTGTRLAPGSHDKRYGR